MVKCLLKVPFGPEIALSEGEFYGVFRHRAMLFFYFGLVCMILFATIGTRRRSAEPELVIGIAALEVMAGLLVVLGWGLASRWRARRTGGVARVHMGWALLVAVLLGALLAEVLDPFLLGVPRSGLLDFAMKLVFYATVTELMTSATMQYVLPHILGELRKAKGAAPTAPPPAQPDAMA